MNSNFEKGGKFYWLHSTVDAFETFLHVPGTVTKKGSHVRDSIDLKRILILVVIAAVPAALFGMWNVGYQHGLAIGDSSLNNLVSGFFIPLIVPVDIPLWMLGVAVAFAVIFGKEVFGGTGMNIVNPAILTRAFLFFSYPNYMSGSNCWIHYKPTEQLVDGFTGATPLALDGASAQYGTGFWDLFIGTVPGSVGETSVLAILLGAIILIWTGIASWKIMLSGVLGVLFVGGIGDLAGITTIPCYMQLLYGGFAFGIVFMATDPVTSAQTECGKWIYGFLIGALCMTVRLFNPGYAEGMMLAILLCNVFAPLIDHVVTSTHISRRAKKLKTA